MQGFDRNRLDQVVLEPHVEAVERGFDCGDDGDPTGQVAGTDVFQDIGPLDVGNTTIQEDDVDTFVEGLQRVPAGGDHDIGVIAEPVGVDISDIGFILDYQDRRGGTGHEINPFRKLSMARRCTTVGRS